MSQQNATYSSHRGMNSFKVLVGVEPNAVITYVSKLYPGSISDKAIAQESGLLNHFTPGAWGYDTCGQGISYSGYCTMKGFCKHPTIPEQWNFY